MRNRRVKRNGTFGLHGGVPGGRPSLSSCAPAVLGSGRRCRDFRRREGGCGAYGRVRPAASLERAKGCGAECSSPRGGRHLVLFGSGHLQHARRRLRPRVGRQGGHHPGAVQAYVPGSGSRGCPRIRSAMTLRCTSLVPPAMVRQRVERKPSSQRCARPACTAASAP